MVSETNKTKQKLEEKLKKLRHEYNEELPEEIAEARKQGDLRENAGYHAARERMGFVKGRIAQLSEQLSILNNIDKSEISEDSIGFGSSVILEDLDSGESVKLTFVTEAEIDFAKGKITLMTPYGKALAGKKTGDEVEVNIPIGVRKFRIKHFSTMHGNEYGEKE